MNAEVTSVWSNLSAFVPLINGTILVGLVGLVTKYRIENRRLSIGENTGLRAEFISEMAALRDEVKGLREENAMLRNEVRSLHGVIDGLRREDLQRAGSVQSVMAEAIGNPLSPAMQQAVDSLKRVPGGKPVEP